MEAPVKFSGFGTPSVRTWKGAAVAIALGLLITGCPEISPTSPYDPATPAAQQATGSIAGQVILIDDEGLYDPGVVLPNVRIGLYHPANAFDPFAERPVDDDGRFSFSEVPTGQWVVSARVSGFAPSSTTVDLGIAEDHTMAPMRLMPLDLAQPEVAAATGTLRGRARLAGQRDHGSVRIEVPGWPYATVTTSDGDWLMTVPPGRYALRYVHAGFGTQISPEVAVAAGDDVTLDDVVLPALPGAIVGRIALGAYDHPERLARSTIELLDERLQLVRTTGPAPSGDFGFDDVSAGAYVVRVACPGYVTQSEPIDVVADRRARLGTVALVHGSIGPEMVRFTGRVRLDDRPEFGGTLVRLHLAPEDIPFSVAITDAGGRFTVPAARDESFALTIERPGYIIPELPVYRWSEASALFEGGGGPLDRVLSREPIDGRINVPVRIGPSWLPARHRQVRVDLDGPNGRRSNGSVTDGAPASFAGLPAGSYRVAIRRNGFSEPIRFVDLDARQPEVDFDPIAIDLESLSRADLDLAGEELDACALRESAVDFRFANLASVSFHGNFGSSDCEDCVMCGPFDLHGVDLSNAVFDDETDMTGVRLTGARMSGVTLDYADFTDTLLDAANLSGARLEGALFVDTNMSNASFLGASMAYSEFIDTARQEAASPCSGDTHLNLLGANFGGASLEGSILDGIDLTGTELGDARLGRVSAVGVCLAQSDLDGVVLTEADLGHADLTGARLGVANLSGAYLAGARLGQAILTGANLEGAVLSLPVGCAPHAFLTPDGDYRELCAEDQKWLSPACCRTELTGANLNGANLAGADLRDADMADASAVSARSGGVQRPAVEEPHTCRLREFALCDTVFSRIDACAGGDRRLPVVDRDTFMSACVTGEVPLQARGDLGFAFERTRTAGLECAVTRVGPDCNVADGVPPADALFDCLYTFGSQNRSSPPYGPFEIECNWPEFADGMCDIPVRAECLSRQTDLRRARLTNADLSTAILVNADVEGTLLTGSTLDNANLGGAGLDGIILPDATIVGLGATGASMDGADLSGAAISDSTLRSVQLTNGSLNGAVVRRTEMSSIRLDGSSANDRPLTISESDLSDASLWDASWPDCELTDVDMDGLSAVGADLQRCNIVGRSNDFSDFWGADLSGAGLIIRGLAGIDLSGSTAVNLFVAGNFTLIRAESANVAGLRLADQAAEVAVFNRSNLDGARLERTVFERFDGHRVRANGIRLEGARWDATFMSESSLTCAVFQRAEMPNAVLAGSNLRGADLTRTTLIGANLSDADLAFADLSGVNLAGARLHRANLLRTRGLDSLTGADIWDAYVCADQRAVIERLPPNMRANVKFVDCSVQIDRPPCDELRCPAGERCGREPIACYRDAGERDLPIPLWEPRLDRWLPEECRNACRNSGQRYAGMQFGGHCFCGNDYGRHGTAPWTECLMPCTADPSQACGNGWRNLIIDVNR